MGRPIYDDRGLLGFQCSTCGRVVSSMLGEDCNACREAERKHQELVEAIRTARTNGPPPTPIEAKGTDNE